VGFYFEILNRKFDMKEVMLHEKNPLTGDWLCWIPDTPQAYYYPTKKKAKEFCDKVNKAFDNGEIKFDNKWQYLIKKNCLMQKR